MSKNTSIALGEHFAGFIDAQLKDGRFASASEVVRAGLRLLEEHEAKMRAVRNGELHGYTADDLRGFWGDGISSGDPLPLSDAFPSMIKRKGRERLAKGG